MSVHHLEFIDDPEMNLEFTCRGGSPDKFAVAFENVSSTMSLDEKMLLVVYWRQHPPAPMIVLEDVVAIETAVNNMRHIAIGMTTNVGTSFAFAGTAILEMPEIILETLIAHELAHACQWVEAITGSLPADERQAHNQIASDDTPNLRQSLETWADKRAAGWNRSYNCDALRTWFNEYIKRKGLT